MAEVEIRYRSRALPRQGEEALVETRAPVRLERVSARQIMPAMPHERSGPSLEKLEIRDLEILVIFGIRGIRVSTDSEIPCQSRALPRQRHASEEAGWVEASGRAAVRLERVSTRPTMPAMPHERSGASLGKLKIRGLEILMIFGNRDFEESELPRIQKLISLPFPRQRRAGKEA